MSPRASLTGALVASLFFLLALSAASLARAQPSPSPAVRAVLAGEEPAQGTSVPEIEEAPDLGELAGKPIRRIEVSTVGGRWASSPRVASVRLGEPLSPEAGRRAVRELLATGGFARAAVEARPEAPDGAALVVHVLPRRLIARVRLAGGVLDAGDTLEAAGVAEGGELTAPMLSRIVEDVRAFYAKHGFTAADVVADSADTDDPMRVVLSIEIVHHADGGLAPGPGAPRMISQRIFVIDPRADREVGDLKLRYQKGSGARVDEPALTEADRDLTDLLRQRGFYRAAVRHAFRHQGPFSYLYVFLDPGPRIVPTFDGNRAFDDDQLEQALALGEARETKPSELAQRLRTFYVTRGFLDAEIAAIERGAPDEPVHYLAFSIRENQQVRVTRRVFPCLSEAFSPDHVGEEIQSFLEEELPDRDPLTLADPRAVNSLFGPTSGGGDRALPVSLNPGATYAPETYDRALKHLVDLFHSRGYLNAIVGPITVVRAACAKGSPPGRCIPEREPARPPLTCPKDVLGLPLPVPDLPDSFTCRPDPKRGVECAPEVTLRIPIHLGPQTTLYDIAFEGNRSFPEKRLAAVAELELGAPLSNVELEAARLRVLDEYRDFGFAYADVRTAIDPSPDRTRARARFVITERDPVTVTGFVVKGATRTDEKLILGRVALRAGAPYRQDLARLSEERIATLGTFSSVSIGLEDADVPQKNKRVVITVAEQLPQYLDPRIGFSTGEGVRFAFEYGHRNIAGEAIAVTLTVQLSYLFDFMILDPDVRDNYRSLKGTERLERSDTASITFPEVGLGPTISFTIDGIDVRDNQRDFGLTKDALAPSLNFRPRREVSVKLGVSGERNDVQLFNAADVETAIQKNPAAASILRVPAGTSFAVAERLGASFDRRDNALAATKGSFFAAGVEHVNAFPSESGTTAQSAPTSHFLRLTSKVAGYVRLSAKGTSVAMSLSAGYNLHLASDSEAYPDRQFFLGGVDSLRAFLADSVIPEDLAQCILDPSKHPSCKAALTVEQVPIRGGDLMLNPRVELRVPVTDTFHAGIFLDTGNLWRDPAELDLLALRYAGGAGLRIVTPIGPLALDYGINLSRRPWEDFGAFHFSIGLF